MAIKTTNREYSECLNGYIEDFICDTEADISSLPKCCPQSTCLVAATGSVYIVNASGEWVKMGG